MERETENGYDEKRYREKMISKIHKYGMTNEEYELFLLQGIKKELMAIRKSLERMEQ